MKKVLIVYSTSEGQTHKIATAIGDHLQESGLAAYVIDVHNIAVTNHIETYDGIIVGAPVRAGKYSKDLRKWVKSKARVISRKPNAFFSVCLGILEKDNLKTQAEERKIATDFFALTEWKPTMWTIFAGALPYSKYNWFIRLIMKRISRKAGGDTDTSRDYEYTDWNEVRSFANEFAQRVNGFGAHLTNKTNLRSLYEA